MGRACLGVLSEHPSAHSGCRMGGEIRCSTNIVKLNCRSHQIPSEWPLMGFMGCPGLFAPRFVTSTLDADRKLMVLAASGMAGPLGPSLPADPGPTPCCDLPHTAPLGGLICLEPVLPAPPRHRPCQPGQAHKGPMVASAMTTQGTDSLGPLHGVSPPNQS